MKRLGDAVEKRLNQPRTPTFRPANESMARGLGWFSIGLGIAEVLLPRAMARALGMQGRENLLFLYGVREIATGIGLLASSRHTPWMWGRVAGDALDMATLAAHSRPGQRIGPAIGMAAVAGVTAVDVATAAALSGRECRHARHWADYSDRSGFPRPAQQMRGAALAKFSTPPDMRNELPTLNPPEPQVELNL